MEDWTRWNSENQWNWTQAQLNNTIDESVASTIAHEIGHGVHLRHCPSWNESDMNCYMWPVADALSDLESQYHTHHLQDYDLKSPSFPQRPEPNGIPPERGSDADGNIIRAPSDSNRQGSSETTTSPVINPDRDDISTTSASYGCNNVAEHDWCSDDGTCTTISDASSDGPCEHRWCLCANYNGGTSEDTSNNGNDGGTSDDTSSDTIISTNTGTSSNGCDYNAEHDYCSDSGSCTTTSDSTSNGPCGHRYCLCANNNGGASYGCGQSEYADYCNDQGSCTIGSASGVPSTECGENYCCCP